MSPWWKFRHPNERSEILYLPARSSNYGIYCLEICFFLCSFIPSDFDSLSVITGGVRSPGQLAHLTIGDLRRKISPHREMSALSRGLLSLRLSLPLPPPLPCSLPIRCFCNAYSTSSKRWVARQLGDRFTREAKVRNLKSRAAFKLLEVGNTSIARLTTVK